MVCWESGAPTKPITETPTRLGPSPLPLAGTLSLSHLLGAVHSSSSLASSHPAQRVVLEGAVGLEG